MADIRGGVARAIASGLDGWNDYDAASDDYKRELLSGADAVLRFLASENVFNEAALRNARVAQFLTAEERLELRKED